MSQQCLGSQECQWCPGVRCQFPELILPLYSALLRHIWSAVFSSGLLRAREAWSFWSRSNRGCGDERTGALPCWRKAQGELGLLSWEGSSPTCGGVCREGSGHGAGSARCCQQDKKQGAEPDAQKFHLNMEKNFLTVQMTEHWNIMAREGVENTPGEIPETAGHSPVPSAPEWPCLSREVGREFFYLIGKKVLDLSIFCGLLVLL